ncbi:MAG TPA: heme-binding protein [Verrucomicrobiae bacterium]|jgi:putative heme-binding domain-containing protein|nr:heme-binding protein [Verrucomicrobiae bacterium]
MNHRFALFAAILGLFAAAAISHAEPPRLTETPFVTVSNPPPIQMLVPGFTVRELPLNLNNLNSFAYAPDGRLFALAYDGNVFELKDTDGDGLEDTATYFYKKDHNEIPASIGMAWGPGGLYIASQGRIIRLRDKGDGTAQLETVTSGWVGPARAAGSSLDAIGMAVDARGNLFFGIGCDDYSAAYRVNKDTGKSEYNVHSERGTIIEVPAGTTNRETIATGLRFTVCLAFNTNGDLFATDQEGATWLPNGNPFDELLYIQRGRHYGFPPRHPKYLPDVIDEPSVFDYAPQHQSTCGLHFNEPTSTSQKIFGPSWWRGDALLTGESRGKIWRTKLVKTADGYVAQNNLIACLTMLTIDAIPTPQGDLLVTCHSGDPDWGTGPQGKGKLFKISYTGDATPQPILTYAASPTETRIVFDRPLDPAQFKNLLAQSSLTMGRYVTAGERFESFRPGYQAVQDQRKIPRYDLPVLAADIAADNRSLILQSLPRTTAVNYAVKIPEPTAPAPSPATIARNLPHSPAIDLLTDLTGVQADWHSATYDKDTPLAWSGWLPHLDLAVAREFTAASAEHAKLFQLLKTPGTLHLRAQLDLWSMLHPAIQPNAQLDYQYPPETVTVIIKSREELKLTTDHQVQQLSPHELHITGIFPKNKWLPLDLTLPTGHAPTLEISWYTDEDPRPRAFPLRRILVPWATPENAQPLASGPRDIPEIVGGDWTRGHDLFFGQQAACYKCHQIGGAGGHIGPDLSNLTYRDYTSVMRDITQPSAAINPDHIAYNIQLTDGDTATGVIIQQTADTITLGQATGENLNIPRTRITNMKASPLSLMPEGLLNSLSAQQQKDLLTFLLTPK